MTKTEDRWEVCASFKHGGKASVVLHRGANKNEVLKEVDAYIDRGATKIVVSVIQVAVLDR